MQTTLINPNIETELHHNCLYYFPSRNDRNLNKAMAAASKTWQCKAEVDEIQQFSFQFLCVDNAITERLYNFNPTEEENPEHSYGRLLLRKLLTDEEGGVLLVRTVPCETTADEDGNTAEKLLLGCDLNLNGTSAGRVLDDFALEAAQVNFQHLTGLNYARYRSHLNRLEAPQFQSNDRQIRIAFLTVGSKDFSKKPHYQKKTEDAIRNRLADLDINWKTATMEEIETWVNKIHTDINDGKKICKRPTVLVDYSETTRNYELMLESGNSRIHLEFGHTKQAQALYIFLLRHPEGVSEKDLPSHRDELLNIYDKLTYRESNKGTKVDNMLNSKSTSIKGLRSEVRKMMESILASGISSDYCIQLDGKRGRMIITLDEVYINLGEFNEATVR